MEVNSITEGQAVDKLVKVYDTIYNVKDTILKLAVVEEKSGARFQLGRESDDFSAFEFLTNLCMSEHIRKDTVLGTH